ncbi:MAG: glycoside hydrolase family 3 C-terminal domain-containing protein [Clostridia bacterium]|nr:glycoside hydrolase family 3 C-terminal domain-containing protein [Clostridia bacterium]
MLKYLDIISQMTLNEKASLCSGKDFWHLKSIERLGIPEIMVCDGPHGLRKQNAENKEVGLTNSYPATCFPTAATTACSWDPELLYEMGQALGEECLKEEVSVVLGPGVNMKRSPLCGRNFEYFSEDPELAGNMAASFINGVKSKGIGTSLKHFAGNSQEMKRMTSNSIIDERALREVYLRAFELAVTKAQPATVMNAYNLVNGHYCSENYYLQRKVLREDWGFEGAVVSDWGAVNVRVDGLRNGNDLEMPSSGGVNDKKIVEAVKNGELDEAILDQTVDNLLDIILKAKEIKKQKYTYDIKAHNEIAKKISAQSMVLLKNEDNILPLSRTPGKYTAIIGGFVEEPRYQGSGSSRINPTMLADGIQEFKNSPLDVKFAKGYNPNRKNDKDAALLIAEACDLAKDADNVVVLIGLTDAYESEGFDRRNMELPDAHNKLIKALRNVNKNIVVVLQGGSPVEMPWINDVKAVLNAYLGGQAVNSAIVDVITGKCNPCGKLAETYPLCLADTPTAVRYPQPDVNSQYRESIFIGYRYYDKVNKNVLFPFGFGLSYTTFEYSDIKLDKNALNKNEGCTVTLKVKNTGSVAGAEIVQVYVGKTESKIFRAPKELKGFKKVWLEAGEEKEVTIELSDRAFKFWNISTSDWCTESGEYKILVGASSRDIRLESTVKVTSDDDALIPDFSESAKIYFDGDPAKATEDEFKVLFDGELPFKPVVTPDSYNVTIESSKDKGLAKAIYNTVDFVMKPAGGVGSSMIANTIMETPVRNFICMSGGLFTEDMADGLLKVFEGKDVGKGLGKIAKGVPNALVNLKTLLKSI